MAIRQGSAFALRTRPLGEADLIVEFFTLEFGRIRAVARSARRLKSRFGSAFEPFTRSRLVWFQRDKDDLGRVSSADIERSWFETLAGLDQAMAAAYLAELVIAFAPERDPAPKLFRLVGAILDALEAGGEPPLITLYFEVWLLRLSGLFPDPRFCGECGNPLGREAWLSDVSLEFLCGRVCGQSVGRRRLTPPARDLLGRCMTQPPAAATLLPATQQATRALAEITRTLVCGHLDRTPRSLRVIARIARDSRLHTERPARPEVESHHG